MHSKNTPIKKVVIAGGGTAGWISAAVLSKFVGHQVQICLVESEEIGTVGVGEATIPALYAFHQLMGIDEQEFMTATNATFKLAIAFENWQKPTNKYYHAFGYVGQDTWAAGFQHYWRRGLDLGVNHEIGDYCFEHLASRENKFSFIAEDHLNHAYHLDASRYATYLRKKAEQFGVKRIEGKIENVQLDSDSGYINSLSLESGEIIEGDLFIDCTGFRSLLLGEALKTEFEDWSHWLLCDRAIAVQTESISPPLNHTRSIAHTSGWQWQIPLQNRIGNGLVYSSQFQTDDDALDTLLKNLDGEPLTTPKKIKFRTGTRKQYWNKNCLAVGLSSGFLEPLESTSIHLIQKAIVGFMLFFPKDKINQADIDEYNAQLKDEVLNIRDFIILHYYINERSEPFWQHCQKMSIPESLKRRIEMFKESGLAFKSTNELFRDSSWVQVMLGQGVLPTSYHTFADNISDQQLKVYLENLRTDVKTKVSQLADHEEFIENYCPMFDT